MVSADRMLRALARSAAAHGCTPRLTLTATRDWASALFVGARYEVMAELEHGAAADAWLAALPEAELAMLRQFAREIRILVREDAGDRLSIRIEAIVVED